MGLTQKLGTIPLAIQTDSSNNVGIGATPTNFGSSYTVLDVYNGTVGGYLLARSPNVTGQISVDNNTAMYVQSRTNHPIVFAPNNSEKMRITTAGNVGIGTTSPTAWNGNQGLLVTQTGTGNTNTIYSLQSGATSVDTGSILEGFSTNTTSGSKALGSIVFLRENTSTTALSSYTAFYTNNGGTVSEKMRLSSGGVLTINGTFVQNPSSGSGGLYIDRGTSTSSPYISWFNGSGTRLGYMGYSNTNIGLYLENSAAFIVSAGDTYLGTSTIDKNSRLVIYGNSTTSSAYTLRCFSSGSDVLFQVRNDGLIQTGTLSGSPYNNTSGAAANMVVTSSGTLERSTSSLKYKTDVKDYDKGLAEVMAMRPVYYKGKNPNDGDKQFAGLIAEEIDALGLNEFVTYAEDGSPDALAYQNMIALLTKAIQELNAKVTALENK